ncbi:peroxiredoxin family protein [Kitasatospora herbaricolor]|uniref:peroxiredoxin family protein n=1 Tax=Kitasatospora herbaricolor TaxID=68217 RepID=UPI0036DD5DEF
MTAPQNDGGRYRQRPGRPLVLAFLDPKSSTSRSQLAVLRSMATQYGPSGLTVALVDATGRAGHDDLVNLRYDWHLDVAGVLVLEPADPAALAHSYGATAIPTTLLIAPDGHLARRWDGTVAPAQDLALPLQDLTASPAASP